MLAIASPIVDRPMNCRFIAGLSLLLLLVAGSPGFSAALDELTRGDVRVATHLRDIEAGALAALKQQFSYDPRLADRGAPFQSTDVRAGGDPPSRRLMLAAASRDTWFIHYEHGGIGLHSHLVALTRSGNSWRVVYSALAASAYDTLPKLKVAIRAKKFDMKADEL